MFSVGIDEIPKRIEKQLEESKQLRKGLQEKNKLVARFQANQLFNEAPAQPGLRIIKKIYEGEEFDYVKLLAQSLLACGSCIALLGNKSEQAQVVFAASDCLNLDLRPLMLECSKFLEGKGGGVRTLVQGGGKNNSNLQAALDWVESQILLQAPPP
jgi:alanyl-tRNA synthetase